MRRKAKNKMLKAVTAIAVVLFILAACCLDSESNIPMIVCGICSAWLGLFTLANM